MGILQSWLADCQIFSSPLYSRELRSITVKTFLFKWGTILSPCDRLQWNNNQHSHAPSARSCPTWLSSLSHCVKCKIHFWAHTRGQEEQTEMEKYYLEFSRKLEHDGKTLLKQTSVHSKYHLSEFTPNTCSKSGEPFFKLLTRVKISADSHTSPSQYCFRNLK